MKKRRLFLLAYGFVLISMWSACFVMNGMSNAYTAAMGLSFTFLSIYFLQKEYAFQLTLFDKACILIFPVILLISTYNVLYSSNALPKLSFNIPSLYQNLFYIHLLNPILIGLIILVLGLTKMKDLKKPVNIFIFTYTTIFYAYFLHPHWMNYWVGTHRSSFDTEITDVSNAQKNNEYPLDYNVNLSKFSFINSKLDTTGLLNDSGKYILIETWSENCFPCVKAMSELPDFYETIKPQVDVYYLYESNKAYVRSKFDKIFSFKAIEDKSKSLIDINQDLYNALKMQGFPYFLLFNSKGNLVYHFRGYPGKAALSTQILEQIQ